MKESSTWRIRSIAGAIILFALILVTKLYFVQIVNGDEFRDKADHQYVRPSERVFSRGNIYFTKKDGTLSSAATVKSGFVLAVNPRQIGGLEKATEAYEKLLPILPELDRADFIARASKENDPYEEVARKIDQDTGKKIERLKIKGVQLYKDKWRFYPGGDLAAHTLGIVGFKGDEVAGRYGLERSFEETLRRGGDTVYVNFFAEVFSNISKTITKKSELEGDVVTTIEPNVQQFLERTVEGVTKKYSSEMTGAIIMNPKTGEIYAMSHDPNFDPNNFQNESDVSIFTNPMVESVREMGSIIKPLTVAAGLDSGAITAKSTYDDKGFLEVDGVRISNFDGIGRGTVDMQRVLSNSLNTGVAYIVQQMGRDTFSRYFQNFGLGEYSGVDLPNEARGLIDNLNSPRDIEHFTASYGQGIATTPLATVRALSALGNGGTLPRPHVVKEIKYKVGFSNQMDSSEGPRVIKKETSEEITRMLVNVVDEALLRGEVKNPRYSIAAKTGTAQIADPKGKGYYKDRYLHSFFGYFPAYNPKFIIFMYTVYPKDVSYASETLTLPFIDLSKFLINYYEIPPDR